MRTATWLVVTHYRPQLLKAAIEALAAAPAPPGWRLETVVVFMVDDHLARNVLDAMGGVVQVETFQSTCGGKRNVGLAAASGELVLVADDDEQHDPRRAAAAIAAYEAGYPLSGVREFRYLHLANGAVVRWRGRGEDDLPIAQVGVARNFDRRLLDQVRGWRPLPRLTEKDLHARLQRTRVPPKEHDLSAELGLGTICLQHAANIWGDRPVIARGVRHRRGDFMLVGEGHWSSVPGFPAAVAVRLGLDASSGTRPVDARSRPPAAVGRRPGTAGAIVAPRGRRPTPAR